MRETILLSRPNLSIPSWRVFQSRLDIYPEHNLAILSWRSRTKPWRAAMDAKGDNLDGPKKRDENLVTLFC